MAGAHTGPVALDPSTYAHLVVNHGEPRGQRILEAPRRAKVRAQTYGGDHVALELEVVATAPGFVCVTQPRPGADPWNAWIPAADATPL